MPGKELPVLTHPRILTFVALKLEGFHMTLQYVIKGD